VGGRAKYLKIGDDSNSRNLKRKSVETRYDYRDWGRECGKGKKKAREDIVLQSRLGDQSKRNSKRRESLARG